MLMLGRNQENLPKHNTQAKGKQSEPMPKGDCIVWGHQKGRVVSRN